MPRVLLVSMFLLAYLRALYPHDAAQGFRILCWRDHEAPPPGATGGWKSRFGVVKQGAGEAAASTDKPSAVGWEKNIHGKLGARVADLAPMMDPTRYDASRGANCEAH